MPAPHEPRAFFGRKRGDKLSPRKTALFDSVLPKVALDLAKPAPATLDALFGRGVKDVRLEIGFGGAEHLMAQARAHPDVGFLACDGFLNAVAKALTAIDEHGLANIRLHHGDAVHLLDWLPPASLAQIELLYPDPWPKRRQWKRRFVQDDNLTRVARVMKRGGIFRFASDIADYTAWTLAHVLQSPDFQWTAERADDWRQPWPDFGGTRYEAKAKEAGRVPCYLSFRRV
jgi:tRNA (guanine-N7-)-methyltransferase